MCGLATNHRVLSIASLEALHFIGIAIACSKRNSIEALTKEAALNELERAPRTSLAICYEAREAGDPVGSPMERNEVIGSKRSSNAALTKEALLFIPIS